MILDSVGGQNLIDSISALAYRGTLVSVEVAARAGSNIDARDLWAKNNTLRGVFLGGAPLNEYPRVHAMIAELIGRVGTGELRVAIDKTFPPSSAAAAHAYIESRQAFGRVVMTRRLVPTWARWADCDQVPSQAHVKRSLTRV